MLVKAIGIEERRRQTAVTRTRLRRSQLRLSMQQVTPEVITPSVFDGIDGVAAAFSTRNGGVSDPPFNSLNTGLAVGDDPDVVSVNRDRLLRALGFALADLVLAHQVHGSDVAVVDRIPIARPRVDGLVTSIRGIVLGISAADCAAVLLADPAAGVVGACHAGWRGAVSGVIENTIEHMKAQGAEPDRIMAWVSPCISSANFEVGPEVARQFASDEISSGRGDRSFVDLKLHIHRRLERGGVSLQNISVDNACTFSDRQRFFSHRRDHGKTGRMLGLIGMRA